MGEEKCPQPEFYDDFIEGETSLSRFNQPNILSVDSNFIFDPFAVNLDENTTKMANEQKKEELKKELSRISNLLNNDVNQNTAEIIKNSQKSAKC